MEKEERREEDGKKEEGKSVGRTIRIQDFSASAMWIPSGVSLLNRSGQDQSTCRLLEFILLLFLYFLGLMKKLIFTDNIKLLMMKNPSSDTTPFSAPISIRVIQCVLYSTHSTHSSSSPPLLSWRSHSNQAFPLLYQQNRVSSDFLLAKPSQWPSLKHHVFDLPAVEAFSWSSGILHLRGFHPPAPLAALSGVPLLVLPQLPDLHECPTALSLEFFLYQFLFPSVCWLHNLHLIVSL